ncbi:amino acid permease [Permianibacter aggregans]|uniref:Arginine/agmatine antiporter n=1 Tax=Permianibacter aggregans TaxID=1510150 RepID=A0A4R6UR17_9GAMM|nr:amino acid permease [Permianibacter aggregans]QGX40381.1 amino acid permease [Permianibacter aggregans]TDQ49491.1 amino acid/polyamine/organocation transporter (APC superfamily) [Permianibacter aggregans]
MNGQHPRLSKIGLWTCTALVIGNMVGSGIFLLPASLAPYGSYSLVGWLITATGALLLARVFSRLAKRMPKAGGPYAYTRIGFGDFPGFLMAWGYWISCWCTNAAIAVAFVSYLSLIFPVLSSSPIIGAALALSTLWGLTFVNILGVRKAGNVQVVTTILKLLPLLALIAFGIWHFQPEYLQTPEMDGTFSLTPVSATVALTLWAFLGLECATIPADNVREPEKTIPRATWIGTVITAIIYVAATTIVMGIVPNNELAASGAPFAEAARRVWGESAGVLMALGAAVSCFGALNGWILIQGQIPKAVADDGLFPRVFARLSKQGTPVFGLIISSSLATLLVLSNYHRGLVDLFTFTILLATLSSVVPYIFCTITEFMQSFREGVSSGRQKLDIVLTLLAFLYAFWAVAGTGQETVFWGFLLLLAGVPIYAIRRIRLEPPNA